MTVWLVAVPVLYAYGALFGLAMTGSRARRAALVGASAATLATPFLLPREPAPLRGFLALALAWVFLRLIELAVATRPVAAGRRVLHAVGMVELRHAPRVRPTLHAPSLLRLLLLGATTVAAFFALAHVVPSDGPTRAARWFAAVVASYASFDALCAFAMLLWRGVGLHPPRLHDDPIKSRSVAEFWGERWNRIVGAWLRVHCFMPLARRRCPRLGLVAAFAASTLLHVYLAWAALDVHAAVMWGVFFLLQIPIVLVERALRVDSWPAAAARAWTLGVFCLASPLFVGPVIRGFEAFR